MLKEEKIRYARQLSHPGFTEKNQLKLRNAKVLIAGVGGLGGAIAHGLVCAGIGRLEIIHYGVLEEPDLNRQTLMGENGVGISRALLASERLKEISSLVQIEAHDKAVTEKVLEEICDGVDLIIDARHNFPERKILNTFAVTKNIPLLFAAMNGMESQAALFVPEKTGCLNCLYPENPQDWDPFGFSVFGAVSHTIGSMAAMIAIKFLSGYGEVDETLISLNMETMKLRHFKLHKDPSCLICGCERHGLRI
ncbi:MAG: HesA/MoeB/ThiF family protein [Nitrospinae bacterium]|nr:HesA/MoeB/ThiF family protein [Nitrospinota bacterium]